MVRFEITIVEAQGLPAADLNGKSDPYCEVTTSGERYKTATIKNTLNPVWRETKVINVMYPANDAVGFLIYDWDRMSANDIIAYGFISMIGIPPNGMPLDHWIPLFKKKKKDNKVQKVAKKVSGAPKPGIPGGRLHIVIRLLDVAPGAAAPMPMAAPMGAYPPQPMPGQPMPGQPYYPPQPMPGQPMPGQPMPGQPYYPPQPMPGQPMPGQPMPGQPYYPPQPMPGQPMMAPPMGAPMPMGPMGVPPGALVIQVPYKGATPIGFQNKSGHLRPKKTDAEVAGHVAAKGAKKSLKVLGKILTA